MHLSCTIRTMHKLSSINKVIIEGNCIRYCEKTIDSALKSVKPVFTKSIYKKHKSLALSVEAHPYKMQITCTFTFCGLRFLQKAYRKPSILLNGGLFMNL